MKWPFRRKSKTARQNLIFRGWNSLGNYSPNWFQLGWDTGNRTAKLSSPTVYTCVGVISQEISRLDMFEYKIKPNGARERQMQSAAARVMQRPNNYQTKSDFFIYLVSSLLLEGNGYAVVERDNRNAVSALHPQDPTNVVPHQVSGTREVYYQIGSSSDYMVPSRDMLHLRVFTGGDMIIGITPLQSLGAPIALSQNIQNQSASFFDNMSRPAGILRTPKPLNPEAAARLQAQWADGMSGNFVGRTAVLDNDVDWRPLSMSAVDAEVIAQYNMGMETIAQVYRVPMFMLGRDTKFALNTVEAFQKLFIMSNLGFYLSHIENAFDKLFGFDSKPDQYMEFDLERGLMRPDFEQRMSAYSKGVTGGILTPNEARSKENLGPTAGGDNVYMQKQNWPLVMLGEDADTEQPTSPDQSEDPSDDDDEEDVTVDEMRAILRNLAA